MYCQNIVLIIMQVLWKNKRTRGTHTDYKENMVNQLEKELQVPLKNILVWGHSSFKSFLSSRNHAHVKFR